jgi:thiol-disulfide isomerase/thioredoxin
MNRRNLMLGLIAGGLGLAGGAGVAWWRLRPAAVADAAARVFFEQRLPTPEGQPVVFNDWRGKVVVINFWATWCPPCVEEMPDLHRLSLQWESKGVKFVGIGVDTASSIQQFQRKVTVAYPLVVAGTVGSELARTLGNQSGGLPYTVIIDRQGRIAHQYLGRIKPATLEADLAPLAA